MQSNQQRLLIHSLCLFFFFLLLLAGCKTIGPASPNRALPAQQTGAKTSLPRISAAPPAGWGVVLDAGFDPGSRGWPIRDDDTAELSVSGGAYQAVIKEKYHSVRLLKKTGMNSLAPFHIQLALQNRSGDKSHFGLLFGGADRNNTYRFTIGPGGRVKTANRQSSRAAAVCSALYSCQVPSPAFRSSTARMKDASATLPMATETMPAASST